ncbi:nucleotidyl transferase AbiEii/AbiGii toxin family protein [Saccharicrinis sp. FJH2]|uniref:nucleotidyl transferase AbiEii/AbiGii toxin family protein n=1 Tax=Saccharicrinis sp. FJH65 TaxID=3344659 RepID=UPI0035F387A2
MKNNQLYKRNEILFQTANTILKECKTNNIELRLFGSVALLFLDLSKKEWLFENRQQFGDIDFVVRSKDIDNLEKLLISLNYENNRNVKMLHGNQRRSFFTSQNISIDFFLDNIILCQPIEINNRFELSYPTLTPTDLFLSKIQRVELKPKDLFDLDYILTFEIDSDYLIQLCSNEWGWWQTFNTNLPVLLSYTENIKNKTKIESLIDEIRNEEKSLKWKWRNLFGTNMRWHNDVEE